MIPVNVEAARAAHMATVAKALLARAEESIARMTSLEQLAEAEELVRALAQDLWVLE
jgi:hypothetical protein